MFNHNISDTFQHDIDGSEFSSLPPVLGRRYKFLKLIGKGSFGVVFICESSESKKLYATKVEHEVDHLSYRKSFKDTKH
ncbi:MAG: hypothetical protein EZS28_050283 [Streblomastix strix]|uniref:Protein kinase domain-containing protein n=1 Tax=Streblomastix strix TaxID=222440 RepID=A0A5J4T9H7_9EUKA|nr:MAG: hypothetical protein EZS28_050283 [Streblomastix strix]